MCHEHVCLFDDLGSRHTIMAQHHVGEDGNRTDVVDEERFQGVVPRELHVSTGLRVESVSKGVSQ